MSQKLDSNQYTYVWIVLKGKSKNSKFSIVAGYDEIWLDDCQQSAINGSSSSTLLKIVVAF